MEKETQNIENTNKDRPIFVVKDDETGEDCFAIDPKKDCPHVNENLTKNLDSALDSLGKGLVTAPCRDCQNEGENWFCLSCEGVYCSRYVKGKGRCYLKVNIKEGKYFFA